MKIPKYMNNSTIHHLKGTKRSSMNFVKFGNMILSYELEYQTLTKTKK